MMKGMVSMPMLSPRYTIVGLPAILIAMAVGISFIKYTQARYLALVLISVMALYSLADNSYYTKVSKEQFRELVGEIIRSDVDVPVYAMKWTSTMFNVYFKQMRSDIRSERADQLEVFLAQGKYPQCFWLIDGHGRLFETNMVDKYHLYVIGKIEKYRTMALLLSAESPELGLCPPISFP